LALQLSLSLLFYPAAFGLLAAAGAAAPLNLTLQLIE
jgi:hypothetical protein